MHCTTGITLLSLEEVVPPSFLKRKILVLLLNQSIHIHFLCLLSLHCKGEPTSTLICGFGFIFFPIPATQTSNSRKHSPSLSRYNTAFIQSHGSFFFFPCSLCQFSFLFGSIGWCGLISKSLMSTNFLLTAKFGLCGHLPKHIDMQPT